MKTLVIYYSFDGNTKFAAETIAKEINADILELKPEGKFMPSKGFMKYFWGGKSVMMKEQPKLLPFEKNPNDYDLIFIGTPVWAGTYTPPLNTFFSQNKITNKKIAIFCTHGGGPQKTLDKMAEQLTENEIIGKFDIKEPLKNNPEESAAKIITWIKDILK